MPYFTNVETVEGFPDDGHAEFAAEAEAMAAMEDAIRRYRADSPPDVPAVRIALP